MSELTNCLLTNIPKLLSLPQGTQLMEDPVLWASSLFEINAAKSTIQFKKSDAKIPDSDDEVIFLDPEDSANMSRFLFGVQTGNAVHGRLQILDFAGNQGTALETADWALNICQQQFFESLEKLHPLGVFIRGSLWLSSGNHKYATHCDAGDGFLIQLTGHKHVRVWPTPENLLSQAVHNFADMDARKMGEPIEFDLQPGQILFIPGGAAHEVVVKNTEPAVSVSFHMGSPYPLMSLCKELNALLGKDDLSLEPSMMSRNKAEIYYFEPTHYISHDDKNPENIPPALAKNLMAVLKAKNTDSSTLSELLTLWWKASIENRSYQGDTPD